MIDLDAARRQATDALGPLCPEPVEAAVFVHRGPETGGGGLRRLFGSKDLAARLHTNNLLVLTPTTLLLVALGGRSGTRPKEVLAAWPRAQVRVEAADADRHTYFASSGSSLDQRVHRLRIAWPEGALVVDVMAEAGLDEADRAAVDAALAGGESDPEILESFRALRETGAETAAHVRAIVTATAPRLSLAAQAPPPPPPSPRPGGPPAPAR